MMELKVNTKGDTKGERNIFYIYQLHIKRLYKLVLIMAILPFFAIYLVFVKILAFEMKSPNNRVQFLYFC